MVKADGFDDAVIGFTQKKNGLFVIVYDASMIMKILMGRDGMTADEATEYFEYNIQGAYVGKQTPIYIFPADIDMIEELAEHLDG